MQVRIINAPNPTVPAGGYAQSVDFSDRAGASSSATRVAPSSAMTVVINGIVNETELLEI